MGMVRDTWRAVLVLVVGVLLLEAGGLRKRTPDEVATLPPPPQVETRWVPPQPIIIQQMQPQPDRPLLRVAAAVTEFGDSVIGVFR
jgi:hypothetical protein